jgi:hypothetical protein
MVSDELHFRPDLRFAPTACVAAIGGESCLRRRLSAVRQVSSEQVLPESRMSGQLSRR